MGSREFFGVPYVYYCFIVMDVYSLLLRRTEEDKRSWIKVPRISEVYEKGVEDFLQFAK